ncbi:DnaB-like helicase N-terminal domain-containing protein [Streptomyces sp. MNP-20]|uniref:DnaB-like helicase N-terminal domain-containing protein n=1 Tax=Streptomyces sp. MNP-20 TaxID=2721165 RepID=UPI0015537CE6|nr:DnaB-like helicase N-terminal domain-containing protein [Streptomyces sp. MNP-20]
MPHPTTRDEHDDLDGPPPEPVHYAEQSLLGALLLDPHRLGETGPLDPGHFSNPAHGALFRAMRAAPEPDAEQQGASPSWLNTVLAAARPHAPALSAPYLHTLIQVCPRPQHAATYAKMIRADHARRCLRLHAGRLAQTAADTTLPHRATATLQQADVLSRFLDGLSGRFPPHPGSLPRTPLPAPPARDTGDEALDEERLLIATATAHPDEARQMRWLAPEDFALPLHSALWQCLTSLIHCGTPIDPVTVLWQAQRHGLLSHDITPTDLLALLSTPVGSPEHWGEKVLQRAVLTRALSVALRITAYADDPANSPHQLATGGRRALADLTALRSRWQHATSPAAPRTTHHGLVSAAPRAGPSPRTAPAPIRAPR